MSDLWRKLELDWVTLVRFCWVKLIDTKEIQEGSFGIPLWEGGVELICDECEHDNN